MESLQPHSFKMWEYYHSHSQLLMRGDVGDDIVLAGVTYLDLPTDDQLQKVETTSADRLVLDQRLVRVSKADRIHTFKRRDEQRYYVVSSYISMKRRTADDSVSPLEVYSVNNPDINTIDFHASNLSSKHRDFRVSHYCTGKNQLLLASTAYDDRVGHDNIFLVLSGVVYMCIHWLLPNMRIVKADSDDLSQVKLRVGNVSGVYEVIVLQSANVRHLIAANGLNFYRSNRPANEVPLDIPFAHRPMPVEISSAEADTRWSLAIRDGDGPEVEIGNDGIRYLTTKRWGYRYVVPKSWQRPV